MTLKPRLTNQDRRRRKGLLRFAFVFGTLLVAVAPADLVNADASVDGARDETAVSARASDSQQASMGSRAVRVCLSPGHPSYPGDKSYEAVLNRRVAYKLKALLLSAGYDVVISTDDLTEETLFAPGFDSEDETHWERLEVKTPEEKARICNDAGADYVISVHHNFAYNPKINYTLVFYSAEEGDTPAHEGVKQWAKATARALGRVMKTDGSRAYSDLERLGYPLRIAADSKAPTILTEGAFYSNPKERRRLDDDTYIEREARAVFDAFHTHSQRFPPPR